MDRQSKQQGGDNAAFSRREVLGGAVAAVASVAIVPRHVLGAGQTPPSEKPVLAGVGVGGVGHGQLKGCDSAGFHIAALCDVDDVYAEKSFKNWPEARRYRDFREMLEAEDKRIDAVYCGTPDHSHALITLAALRKGKHVACVKPLTRTIAEGRLVMKTAREAGVATQVTASPNTSPTACRTCELIWAGAIGPVREVHIWSNRPLWPQGMLPPSGRDPVPSTFDWDLWLGPAKQRPFKAEWPDEHYALSQVNKIGPPKKAVYHPWNFRGWWDFGTGALGDMGCHHLNTPYRALKLKFPIRVSASATKVSEHAAPLASIVTYDFPEREGMPPVRIIWYDGGLKPPCPPELDELPGSGELYIGDEGKMLGRQIIPTERARKFASVPETLERRGGTWPEWYEAVRGGQEAGCPFDWAGALNDFVLVGNIAIRTGEVLDYDGENMRFDNSDKANDYVSQPYENGWSL